MKVSESEPRAWTSKPPLPHRGAHSSEPSPLTLTVWPGVTVISVLMPTSSSCASRVVCHKVRRAARPQ
eukprot:COSAG02_NODE_10620_length_1899_cov_1.294444_1_plen_67_part_10